MATINASRDATQPAHDLAAYIVQSFAPRGVGTLKLQKLLYYIQGWHLGFLGTPLYEDRVEAWKHGPVLPGIYQFHKTTSEVDSWDAGDASRVQGSAKLIADAVLKTYGHKSGWALREQTHDETPWLEAWEACGQGRHLKWPISQEAITDYFADQVSILQAERGDASN